MHCSVLLHSGLALLFSSSRSSPCWGAMLAGCHHTRPTQMPTCPTHNTPTPPTPQAMLSHSCEFYGNMDRHQPANCQLADVVGLALRHLDAMEGQTRRRPEGRAAESFMYLAQQPLTEPGAQGPETRRLSSSPQCANESPCSRGTRHQIQQADAPPKPTVKSTQASSPCWQTSPGRAPWPPGT